MSNFKFERNDKGVSELLNSKEMEEVLMAYANQISSKAGKGYKVKKLKTRVVAVTTSNKKSREDNLKNNTLLKAVYR